MLVQSQPRQSVCSLIGKAPRCDRGTCGFEFRQTASFFYIHIFSKGKKMDKVAMHLLFSVVSIFIFAAIAVWGWGLFMAPIVGFELNMVQAVGIAYLLKLPFIESFASQTVQLMPDVDSLDHNQKAWAGRIATWIGYGFTAVLFWILSALF